MSYAPLPQNRQRIGNLKRILMIVVSVTAMIAAYAVVIRPASAADECPDQPGTLSLEVIDQTALGQIVSSLPAAHSLLQSSVSGSNITLSGDGPGACASLAPLNTDLQNSELTADFQTAELATEAQTTAEFQTITAQFQTAGFQTAARSQTADGFEFQTAAVQLATWKAQLLAWTAAVVVGVAVAAAFVRIGRPDIALSFAGGAAGFVHGYIETGLTTGKWDWPAFRAGLIGLAEGAAIGAIARLAWPEVGPALREGVAKMGQASGTGWFSQWLPRAQELPWGDIEMGFVF